MGSIQKRDVDRLLRSMRRRLDANKLEPVLFSGSIAMHGTMQVDGGNARLVCVQNVVNVRQLLHISGTFVVNDDVVSLRPVGVIVHVEASFGAFVGRVNERHFDHGSRFDSPLENFLLFGVVVTAPAGDEQCLDRLGARRFL